MNEQKQDLMLETEENKSQNDTKIELRKRLLKRIGILIGILLLIFLVIFIIQLVRGRTLTYEEIENEMKKAAKQYYQVQKELLPTKEGEKVTVSASVLSDAEYMKPLSEYTKKDVACTGEVQVARIGKQYRYTPYLDCGQAYTTKELYKAVLEQGIVTTEYGLYQIGNEYVYRGEKVSNYVSFEGAMFRIVKITPSNETVLILDDQDYMPAVQWDNRYNQVERAKTGINNYHVSRIKEALDVYYEESTKDTITFTKSAKEKLVPFSLCVGARDKNYAANDNTQECSLIEENQNIGLLTVSDYLNASTDPNCHAPTDRSCQNYNYLRINDEWWLATPSTLDTTTVYYVTSSGAVSDDGANGLKHLRPILHLSDSVMIKSGKGTETNPFVLK